jgi:hypothetical protein
MRAPPESDQPTVAMLNADIDSGRTGDKNPVFDPAMSPLGTDDEAAGHPPDAAAILLAREYEHTERDESGAGHEQRDGLPVGYIGFIFVVGLVLVTGVYFVR